MLARRWGILLGLGLCAMLTACMSREQMPPTRADSTAPSAPFATSPNSDRVVARPAEALECAERDFALGASDAEQSERAWRLFYDACIREEAAHLPELRRLWPDLPLREVPLGGVTALIDIREAEVPPAFPDTIPRRGFVTAGSPMPGYYTGTIGTPHCNAGYCDSGTLSGKRLDVTTPWDTPHLIEDSFRATGDRVALTEGIEGWFFDFECGASCSSAIVYWIDGDYEYVVGLIAGDKEEVVAFANATIRNMTR